MRTQRIAPLEGGGREARRTSLGWVSPSPRGGGAHAWTLTPVSAQFEGQTAPSVFPVSFPRSLASVHATSDLVLRGVPTRTLPLP